MIKHRIHTELPKPAQIVIAGGNILVVTTGEWPYFGGVQEVKACAANLLPEDRFVYLDPSGQIVLSADPIAYGRNLAGKDQTMRDLLAWKEGEDWHAKELYHDAEQ
jgi:hypothetical protein